MATFKDFLNERNITLKRRYTEAHPAKTVGNSAKVRNAIIEALKDGKITVAEFNDIVAKHSMAPAKWTRGNKRFFKIEEDGVSLSNYGQKILNSLVTESVNEKSFDKMVSKSKYDYDNVPSSLDLKDDERNLDEPVEMKNIKKFQRKYGTKMKVTTDNKPIGKRVTVYMEPGVEDGPDEIMDPQLKRHEEMMDFVKKHNLKISIADTVKGEWTFWTRYGIDESTITEARVDAKKLLKSVVNGETNSVEGIKLSKGMAGAFSDWLENSTYGKKFSKLPFEKLFTAAFNWGIERYAKSGELKDELKNLKTKAKAMKESKIYESFSEFVINEKSMKDWFLANIDSFKDEKEYMKAGKKAGFSKKELEDAMDDFEQGGEDYLESNEVNENYEVIYSDGISAMKKFSNERKARAFFYDKIRQKGMKNAAIYKAGSGFHSTSQTEYVVAFWGDGSYLDNVSKKDAELAKKKVTESIDEGLNKSDVAYQLAIDYTGRTKPKITKLNKKRIQIKYGYKISPQKVIDSIKTVHPEVELKHVEWSDSMTGGGFHIFDILESAVTEARYDKKKLLKRLGDADDATVQTGDGKEYIIYNPDSNNDDNAAMWHDNSVSAIDQDGDEYEIPYKDIKLVMTESNESINEAKDPYKEIKKAIKGMKGVSAEIKGDEIRVSNKAGDEFVYSMLDNDDIEEFISSIEESKNDMIHTKFTDFVNETYMPVNEALKSSKLRGLISMKNGSKDILRAIYGHTKIALDKIEDHQIQDIDPKQGKKAEGLVVYYTTQEKENPYADREKGHYNDSATIPANTILAIGMGKDVAYMQTVYNRAKREYRYSLTTNPKSYSYGSNQDIGINKNYRGWNASGIYNVKRVIDLADGAFVINPKALPDTDLKTYNRAKAREGAVAFKSDKEFKDANMQRYEEILQKRASTMDIDKLVEDAINDMAEMMKDAIKNKQKNKYGEIIAGVGEDGRAYKINDISNFTSNLLRDYERWAGYMATIAAKEELPAQKDLQWEIKYATGEAKKYAKEIRDRLAKLKKRNIAW